MKNYLTFSLFLISINCFSQAGNDFKKNLVNTWRVCGLEEMQEQDTLFFTPNSNDCRAVDCGEHQWSFREGGSVEFMFTTGCNTGFQSKAQNPERWLYSDKKNVMKLISIDAFVRYFEILTCTESQLTLKRRKDLEQ